MNSLSLCRGSTVAMRGSRRVGEWSRERAEVDRNSYPLIASMRRRSFLSPVVVLTYEHTYVSVVVIAAQSNVSLRSIYSCCGGHLLNHLFMAESRVCLY